MRRFLIWLFALLCCFALACPVLAATQAEIQSQSTVHADGRCTVLLSLTLHADAANPDLVFPLPGNASDITCNGLPTAATSGDGVLSVPLSIPAAGDYTYQLSYTLPGTVRVQDGQPVLTLPLLCGFAYPLKGISFTVSLPGPVDATPSFTSVYYQEDINTQMSFAMEDATIIGSVNRPMKDHEALTMTLPVPQSMFPQTAPRQHRLGIWELATLGCVALAALYYLLVLSRRRSGAPLRTTPPEGIPLGLVGCFLSGSGADLARMCVAWAQMGYLLIHLDEHGNVTLHRQMEMGNERSGFENRCYRSLFGKRRSVDGSGAHYQQLYHEIAGKTPLRRVCFRRGSVLPYHVLLLCAGAVCGAALAHTLPVHATLMAVLAAALAALGAATFHITLKAGMQLPRTPGKSLGIAAVCAALWLGLGALAGQLPLAAAAALLPLPAGRLVAYGGRRTPAGTQYLAQLLGLRKFMRTASHGQLQSLLLTNPNYFYTLAPYALALGADRRFARSFGRRRLPECTWLVAEPRTPQTATEWTLSLRRVMETLTPSSRRSRTSSPRRMPPAGRRRR